MQPSSRPVSSNQRHLHPDLPRLVQRHLRQPSRRPVADHSRRAFHSVEPVLARHRHLILDSFCGTGQSTAILAARFPGHLVIGVDKSAQRLSRHVPAPCDNYRLLRADCEDVWQLLLEAKRQLTHHFLLYPNPWPKAAHLQRRVHGSAALDRLLRLGGELELRSNWQIYVEEFGLALHLAGCPGVVARLPAQAPMTLFEQKYQLSGHALWRFSGRACTQGLP